MKRLVILPTLNEEASIAKTIEQINICDVIVCDGGSTDRTLDIVRSLEKPYLNCESGYGKVILEGFKFGLDNGYDQLIVMDCESHTFKEITPYLNGDYDILAGKREEVKKSLFRKIITAYGKRMIPVGGSTKVKDLSNGFRAYSKRFVQKVLSIKGIEEVPSYNFNSIVAFYAEGYKVYNFPMTYVAGKSGLTFKELVKSYNYRLSYNMQYDISEDIGITASLDDVVAFLKMHYSDEFVRFVIRRNK